MSVKPAKKRARQEKVNAAKPTTAGTQVPQTAGAKSKRKKSLDGEVGKDAAVLSAKSSKKRKKPAA